MLTVRPSNLSEALVLRRRVRRLAELAVGGQVAVERVAAHAHRLTDVSNGQQSILHEGVGGFELRRHHDP